MSDLEDSEDFNLDENETEDYVILADLEWSPMPEFTPWDDPDFAQDLVDRVNGLTINDFAREVKLWQRALKHLPHYDEIQIRQEIAQWNIGIPSKDNFDHDTYTLFYYLQVQYKNRLSQIHSVINAHYEMLIQAEKSLKFMAGKLSKGTAKEKDGYAAFTVSPFTVAITHSHRLLAYLESISKNIDFAAAQMDRLLKEHQALTRINNGFLNDGMSSFYNRTETPKMLNNMNSAVIRTSNKRITKS